MLQFDVRLPAKARGRVGKLRGSVEIARSNYKQFGGVPEPSPLLEMLEDQDFGDNRPAVTTKSPPVKTKDVEQAAAISK